MHTSLFAIVWLVLANLAYAMVIPAPAAVSEPSPMDALLSPIDPFNPFIWYSDCLQDKPPLFCAEKYLEVTKNHPDPADAVQATFSNTLVDLAATRMAGELAGTLSKRDSIASKMIPPMLKPYVKIVSNVFGELMGAWSTFKKIKEVADAIHGTVKAANQRAKDKLNTPPDSWDKGLHNNNRVVVVDKRSLQVAANAQKLALGLDAKRSALESQFLPLLNAVTTGPEAIAAFSDMRAKLLYLTAKKADQGGDTSREEFERAMVMAQHSRANFMRALEGADRQALAEGLLALEPAIVDVADQLDALRGINGAVEEELGRIGLPVGPMTDEMKSVMEEVF